MSLLNRIFNKKKSYKKIDDIKDHVIKSRKKSIKDLRKLNKEMKFLIKEGQIEITIKSIKGVVEEIK